jgi:hypothetical protein
MSNTKITLRTNAAGEKEVAEIQVAGERFKHLLPGQAASPNASLTSK